MYGWRWLRVTTIIAVWPACGSVVKGTSTYVALAGTAATPIISLSTVIDTYDLASAYTLKLLVPATIWLSWLTLLVAG